VALVVFIVVVAAVALSGSRFRPDARYEALRKPSFNPPKAVFGPVWAILYLAIAVSGWRAWTDGGHAFTPALALWVVQLALNGAWSWLFFGRHRMDLALVDIVALLVAIVGYIVAVAPQSALAAWLFAPYAAWVAFATVLNAAFLMLNPRRAATSAP
jgi:tryptophan-rich sensory protein